MKELRPASPRFWIVTTLAALALRCALLPLSPRVAYVPDHADFVRWGIQAVDEGLPSLYTRPPAPHETRIRRDGAWQVMPWPGDRICNYPPASTYLLYVSGLVHRLLDDDRLVNTTLSHFLFSFWSILGDFLLALGGASVVGLLADRRAAKWTFALLLFLPPLWWDTMLWGQWDSMVVAPAMWMLRFALQGRFRIAGVLWGAAAAIKPQALYLVPLWGLLLLAGGNRRGVLAGIGAGAATLLVLSLPHALATGFEWWRRSYWDNVFSGAGEYTSFTTLKAFNVWYADFLLTGAAATDPLLGVARRTWGAALLLIALGGGMLVCLRRGGPGPRTPVLYAALSTLAFVMVPTAVHERYLIVALPFLVVTAMVWSRFWPPVAILAVVATAQVSWPLWMQPSITGFQLGVEWGFVVLALLATALVVVAALEVSRQEAGAVVDPRHPVADAPAS